MVLGTDLPFVIEALAFGFISAVGMLLTLLLRGDNFGLLGSRFSWGTTSISFLYGVAFWIAYRISLIAMRWLPETTGLPFGDAFVTHWYELPLILVGNLATTTLFVFTVWFIKTKSREYLDKKYPPKIFTDVKHWDK